MQALVPLDRDLQGATVHVEDDLKSQNIEAHETWLDGMQRAVLTTLAYRVGGTMSALEEALTVIFVFVLHDWSQRIARCRPAVLGVGAWRRGSGACVHFYIFHRLHFLRKCFACT